MKHSPENKHKLLVRIKKIRGQLNALERVLVEEKDCFEILQQAVAIRGSINSLMSGVLEEHIKQHLIQADTKSKREKEVINLLSILKSYFK
ncbi:metal/formaldehyde-sensitive transcriptional repressor [Campylobacter troglodytis]|uniref:metal/formaldehyde-sensitive transcriptional repressor n=1 Tax=Campylobacter troglodytis TaxID=654363 RepID=UPI00115B01DE|nr:metal/formaldehyde-sensitive transcriptional repressor [Campylobacter troglodytis]TQR59642.1 transcriptional repressor rcnR [Campylobacter troglodytis]